MPSHVPLRQFRYFIAVAESGSVAAASRTLKIAQSAVTTSMQELQTNSDSACSSAAPTASSSPRGAIASWPARGD